VLNARGHRQCRLFGCAPGPRREVQAPVLPGRRLFRSPDVFHTVSDKGQLCKLSGILFDFQTHFTAGLDHHHIAFTDHIDGFVGFRNCSDRVSQNSPPSRIAIHSSNGLQPPGPFLPSDAGVDEAVKPERKSR
jgi:hypothetical protein